MIETNDGWIPNPDRYDVSNGLFFLAGKISFIAICQSGSASNFFQKCVFNHFLGGTENGLQSLS